jgi:hypothetical protein
MKDLYAKTVFLGLLVLAACGLAVAIANLVR